VHKAEVTHYYYNAEGKRISKKSTSGTSYYIYGLDGNLVEEINQSGSRINYVYHDNEPVAQIINNSEVYFYQNNHLGVPESIVDQYSKLVWQSYTLPFGLTVLSSENEIDNPIRFPGMYSDRSDLYYNNARYYDPSIGRYLQPDPIGLAGGINRYSYVHGNPVNLIDSTGKYAQAIPSLLMASTAVVGAYYQ